MTPRDEQLADDALLSLSKLRDNLVMANKRVAAELVESAIQTIEDACRVLLSREMVDG